MPNVSTASRLIPRENVAYRATDTGGMLIDLQTGGCFELNKVGRTIWARLTAGDTVEDIVNVLRSQFDMEPNVLEADVKRLCVEVLNAGLADVRNLEPT